jgi:putative transposase
MAKVLRIEFPGAVYHVTSRGNRRERIFVDDDDRRRLLAFVKQAMERYDAAVMAYCLMGNHYHFVLQTRRANLARVMRHINGKFSQAFNRRHGLVGHLFQSRYNSILVDRDAYLMALCRYVELNPVRAGLVAAPSDWVWSSYAAHVGSDATSTWLDTEALHGHLLGRPVRSPQDRQHARTLYEQLVSEGRDDHFWQRSLREKIYLGEDEFIARARARIEPSKTNGIGMSAKGRRQPRTTAQSLAACATREEAAWRMHVEGGIRMSDIAQAMELSASRVSRLISRFENAGQAADARDGAN